ncbi:MAG: multicopper oxidase family protein [Deltaproteobacteria bacterium]|nr:multicopper oxidase family protein [Deltaproteobacteria bacterium]
MPVRTLAYGLLFCALVACASTESEGPDAPPANAPDISSIATLTDTNPDPNVVEVSLVAAPATVEYLTGKTTDVWAYRDGAAPAGTKATIPGPALRAKRGNEVIVHFKNELPEPTTIHWHGLRLLAKMDGSTSTQASIPSGGTYEYRFRVEDAGTFWYHPHVRANEQIERGLYAPLLVTEDDAVDVTADRTFVLDDVKLEASGALSASSEALDTMVGKQGNVLLVNGRRGGALTVPQGARERWRFVNAANGRYFNLRVPGRDLLVIGTDGGLVPVPYRADTVLMAPGERYELLVSFDEPEGARAVLETIHYDRGHELPDQGPRTLFDIEVRGRSERILRPVPAQLRTIAPLDLPAATVTKRFALQEREAPDGVIFSINGESWPFNAAIMVKQGATEIWEIESPEEMDHPFHLHGMFFQILGADGRPDLTRGWKDTVNVKRGTKLRFAVRYEPLGMWMFHCHILEHAERGMMGELMVMQ